LAQQGGVRALLDEQAVLHDEDEVGVDDRLQLVRHHHGGHVPARGVDHLDHRALDERVERARRLVAQQQRGPAEQRARHGDALPLAARERLVRVRVRVRARARARVRVRVRPESAWPRSPSPISPLHLPYISPTSPLHLP